LVVLAAAAHVERAGLGWAGSPWREERRNPEIFSRCPALSVCQIHFLFPFLPDFAAFPSRWHSRLGPPVSFQLCLGSNPLKWKSTFYKE
jgi:hypothetical protein